MARGYRAEGGQGGGHGGVVTAVCTAWSRRCARRALCRWRASCDGGQRRISSLGAQQPARDGERTVLVESLVVPTASWHLHTGRATTRAATPAQPLH